MWKMVFEGMFPLSLPHAILLGMILCAGVGAALDAIVKIGMLRAAGGAGALIFIWLANGWLVGFGVEPAESSRMDLFGAGGKGLAVGLALFAVGVGCAAAQLALAGMGKRGSKETAASLAISVFLAIWIGNSGSGTEGWASGLELGVRQGVEWLCMKLLVLNAILVAVGAARLKAWAKAGISSWLRESWALLWCGWRLLLMSAMLAWVADWVWGSLTKEDLSGFEECVLAMAFSGRASSCGYMGYGASLNWKIVAGGVLQISAMALGGLACFAGIARRAPLAHVRKALWAAFGALGGCSGFWGWCYAEKAGLFSRLAGEYFRAQVCARGLFEEALACQAGFAHGMYGVLPIALAAAACSCALVLLWRKILETGGKGR